MIVSTILQQCDEQVVLSNCILVVFLAGCLLFLLLKTGVILSRIYVFLMKGCVLSLRRLLQWKASVVSLDWTLLDRCGAIVILSRGRRLFWKRMLRNVVGVFLSKIWTFLPKDCIISCECVFLKMVGVIPFKKGQFLTNSDILFLTKCGIAFWTRVLLSKATVPYGRRAMMKGGVLSQVLLLLPTDRILSQYEVPQKKC